MMVQGSRITAKRGKTQQLPNQTSASSLVNSQHHWSGIRSLESIDRTLDCGMNIETSERLILDLRPLRL